MTSLDRLAASRARLQAALLEITHPPPQERLFAHGLGGLGSDVLSRLKRLPLLSLVIDAAQGWWRQHPLHAAGSVAASASMQVIKPYAQRRPAQVLLLAAVGTVLLLLLRPWRLLYRPTLLVSMASGIALYALKNRTPREWLNAIFPQPH